MVKTELERDTMVRMPKYGEIIVMSDGARYRAPTSLSLPLPSQAAREAQKRVVKLNIWLYLNVAKDAGLLENGKPVVWLSPDEEALPVSDEEKVKLAYRRYVRNNVLRQLNKRRADKRISVPGDIPFSAEALLAE